MSATPTSNPPTPAYPERTPEDHDAMFASVVWFRQQEWGGAADEYQGMYVAILGEQVIDADEDNGELVRRLEARREQLPLNRVAVQYLPNSDGPIVCPTVFLPDVQQ